MFLVLNRIKESIADYFQFDFNSNVTCIDKYKFGGAETLWHRDASNSFGNINSFEPHLVSWHTGIFSGII